MFWKFVISGSFDFIAEFLARELAPKNGDWTFLTIFFSSGTDGS
jgi:hypothetical protein